MNWISSLETILFYIIFYVGRLIKLYRSSNPRIINICARILPEMLDYGKLNATIDPMNR